MTRWLVTLAGDAADLDRLVELPDGDVWQVVRQDKRGVVLCGARFEALDDHASLRRAAEDLIEHLNRAARHRLTEFQGVTLGATVEQVQGGDHLALLAHDAVHVHVAAKATVHAHVRLDAAIADPPTQSNTPQPGADFARLVALLARACQALLGAGRAWRAWSTSLGEAAGRRAPRQRAGVARYRAMVRMLDTASITFSQGRCRQDTSPCGKAANDALTTPLGRAPKPNLQSG